MIFSDELKDKILYKNKLYLPITDEDKRKGSVVFLASPNPESSMNILANPILDKRYYRSYYIEKNIMYYINQEGYIISNDTDQEFIQESIDIKDLQSSVIKRAPGVPKGRNTYYDHNPRALDYSKITGYEDEIEHLPEDTEDIAMDKAYKNARIRNKKRDLMSQGLIIESTDSIQEVFIVSYDKNFKIKEYLDLNSYKKIPVTSQSITEYKPSCNSLIHLRCASDYEGTIFLDGDNVVGYVNVDYSNLAIQALEITEEYRGHGLGNQLLKYAMKKHDANNLTVNKRNEVAYKMYTRNGFRDYRHIGTVVFMKTSKAKIDEASYVGTTLPNEMDYVSDVDYIRVKENGKDKVFGFYNESVSFVNEVRSYNNMLRKILYKDRFKTPSDVLNLYEEIKKLHPEITKTFLDYTKYKSENLIVDLSYYHKSFFADTTVQTLDRLSKIYQDFLNRLITDSRLDDLYLKKTVIYPLEDWETFSKDNNPLELILYLLKKSKAKNALLDWENIDFLILTDFGYFKLSPDLLEREDITRVNTLKTKLLNKEPIIDDTQDSKKAIVASITDDLENKQNIQIHSLTGDKNNEDKDILVKTINKAAEKTNTKDDALDVMDNEDADRIKEIITKLSQEDDEVKISATRRARMDDAQSQTLNKKIKNKSIKDMIDESKVNTELPETKLTIDSVNEEWQHLKFTNFEDTYNVDDDILRILNFFASKKNPVVMRDINIEDTSTSEDFVYTYNVSMEDAQGQRFKLVFDVPRFRDHKFMYLRGNEKTFNSQLMLIPISKSDNDTVQIVSNYKKIFIRRYNTASGKSYQTADILVKALSKYEGKDIKISYGDNTKVCRKYSLPIDYVDLASIYNKIETPQYKIYFNLDEFNKLYKDKIDNTKGIPLCIDKSGNITYYTYGLSQTCSDLIISLIYTSSSKEFQDLSNSIKPANKYTYSQASILASKIPLIILLSYNEGLTTVLEKANIKYDIREKKGFVRHDESFIKFNNGFIVYMNTYESSLLLNGMKECNTEDYPIEDINNKAMYLDFLELFGGRILADGLDNFYELMLEPITTDVLERYKLPTDYVSLLIEANSILADNDYTRHIDMSSNRFRSNEILAGYTYQCLANAYGDYSSALKKTKKLPMSMKKSAIIDAIMADPTCGDNSSLNDLGIVEAINTVSFKGLAGMNSDRSYSLDKRTFDKSMVNLLAMSTGFAGNVGLNRQSTVDMNIEGKRGYLKIDPDVNKMSPTKTFSITEAVTPFGATRDDPFRTAMTFIQTSKHGMRTKKSMPSLISTGADQALPYLSSNTFSHVSKKAGRVAEKTDEYIMIQYDDGTSDYISLANNIQKNSNGGFFISIKLETNLKTGDKVKPNQILAYDPLSYSDCIGDTGDLAYCLGPLVKVIIMNTDEGYEDSAIISEYLSEEMTSDVVLEQDVTLEKMSNVYFMVQKGQVVKEGDPLIIFQNAFDDNDVNILLKNLSDDEDEIAELGRRTKKSHVEGIVEDIKIYRTCEKEEMSDSLKKIISKYEKPIADKRKLLEKYNIEGYKALIPADYKLSNSGKLKNLEDGVFIEFYLKYEDKMSIGDKLVYYSANKGVVKDIFPEGDEPTSEFRPDEKCGSILSIGAINARMVTSILNVGGINKGLIELDRKVKDMCGIKWKYLYE